MLPRTSFRWLLVGGVTLALAPGCSGSDEGGASSAAVGGAAGAAGASSGGGSGVDAGADALPGDAEVDSPTDGVVEACPAGMVHVAEFCIDRFEAPNREGEPPLVMYTFDEAEAWCSGRGKRLCFDDEWTESCAGVAGNKYPYGNVHQPGTCNDEETWRLYDQSKLNAWPWTVSTPAIETLAELLDATRAVSASATVAADHVEWLYQGEMAGENPGCTNAEGVRDLVGNVEEWTRRRDGGDGPELSGALKGRYWAESRTCQSAVLTHANGFRFYEIGFRCCADAVSFE